jgi:hypothetical protein
MKTTLKMILAAGLLGGASLMAAAPAMAQPRGFSFRIGDVAIGYTDGYYDHAHTWHSWRNARERSWYRSNYHRYNVNYRGMRHDRDHDGVPDRVDRDRDGDGVPNRVDRNPNNPYR